MSANSLADLKARIPLDPYFFRFSKRYADRSFDERVEVRLKVIRFFHDMCKWNDAGTVRKPTRKAKEYMRAFQEWCDL